jgi:hypothetical protein
MKDVKIVFGSDFHIGNSKISATETHLNIKDWFYPEMIKSNVVFLGGDSDPAYINDLAFWIRINYPKLKIAWYSGKPYISSDIKLINFDYIKYGPYQEENGPLTSKTTNQKMIHIEHFSDTLSLNIITSKFWK